MEIVIETNSYRLCENERGDLLLENKKKKEFSCFLTGDMKVLIREILSDPRLH